MMMIKPARTVIIIFIFLLNASLQIGAEEKYVDLVRAYTDYYDRYVKFADDIAHINDPEKMAVVINNFSDDLQLIIGRILVLKNNYPELDTIREYPQNLKSILIKINKFYRSTKLRSANDKTYSYKGKSDAMARALKRLETVNKKSGTD